MSDSLFLLKCGILIKFEMTRNSLAFQKKGRIMTITSDTALYGYATGLAIVLVMPFNYVDIKWQEASFVLYFIYLRMASHYDKGALWAFWTPCQYTLVNAV